MSNIKLKAEVLHHKKRLVNVHGTEPANKKRQFNAFCEDSIDMSRLGHVRGEMYTKILDILLTT